jgi:hypothetical protein
MTCRLCNDTGTIPLLTSFAPCICQDEPREAKEATPEALKRVIDGALKKKPVSQWFFFSPHQKAPATNDSAFIGIPEDVIYVGSFQEADHQAPRHIYLANDDLVISYGGWGGWTRHSLQHTRFEKLEPNVKAFLQEVLFMRRRPGDIHHAHIKDVIRKWIPPLPF